MMPIELAIGELITSESAILTAASVAGDGSSKYQTQFPHILMPTNENSICSSFFSSIGFHQPSGKSIEVGVTTAYSVETSYGPRASGVGNVRPLSSVPHAAKTIAATNIDATPSIEIAALFNSSCQ